jgi:hypothetical protein
VADPRSSIDLRTLERVQHLLATTELAPHAEVLDLDLVDAGASTSAGTSGHLDVPGPAPLPRRR